MTKKHPDNDLTSFQQAVKGVKPIKNDRIDLYAFDRPGLVIVICDRDAEPWTIVGGEHSPALTTDFSTQVANWLFDHPKTGPDCLTSTVNSGSGFIVFRSTTDTVFE